jgi:hypothetical protein
MREEFQENLAGSVAMATGGFGDLCFDIEFPQATQTMKFSASFDELPDPVEEGEVGCAGVSQFLPVTCGSRQMGQAFLLRSGQLRGVAHIAISHQCAPEIRPQNVP